MKNRTDVLNWGGWKLHLVFSAIIAVIATLQVYPFIGLADGFTRWNLALEICSNGEIVSDTLLSPVIPYIQAFTYKITGSYGLYTVLQAIAFYFMIGILIKNMLGDRKTFLVGKNAVSLWNLISGMVIFFPTVYVFPLLLTDSAPIFSLMAALIVVLDGQLTVRKKALALLIVSFFSVGIRVNSLVLFGFFFLFLLFFAMIKKDKVAVVLAGVIIVGACLGAIIPSKITPGSYNASTLGMVWELTGMAANGNEEVKEELSAYGDIDEAIERYGDPYLNSIVWDNDPPFPATVISSQYAKDITRIYLNQFIKHPVSFIKNKFKWIKGSLGVPQYLISSTRGVHGIDELTQSRGGIESYWQSQLRSIFFGITDKIGFFTLCPMICGLTSGICILVCHFLKMKVRNAGIAWLVGAAYYSSFLINTQAFEFRYFAPTFYIWFLIMICSLIDILNEMIRRGNHLIRRVI